LHQGGPGFEQCHAIVWFDLSGIQPAQRRNVVLFLAVAGGGFVL
jgi:hypothetical protein